MESIPTFLYGSHIFVSDSQNLSAFEFYDFSVKTIIKNIVILFFIAWQPFEIIRKKKALVE